MISARACWSWTGRRAGCAPGDVYKRQRMLCAVRFLCVGVYRQRSAHHRLFVGGRLEAVARAVAKHRHLCGVAPVLHQLKRRASKHGAGDVYKRQ